MIVRVRDRVAGRSMARSLPQGRRAGTAARWLTCGAVACLLACSATEGDTAEKPAEKLAENRAPRVAVVRDGLDADQDEQELSTTVFANWDPFVDPGGAPVIYEWCVGRSPGAADVMPWMGVGGATSAASRNVDPPVGFPLYVSVRAIDIAGNRSGIATSDGIVLGITAAKPVANAEAPGDGVPRYPAVERFGITWTFDRPVPCGRFVNGDWWVVGPVDIVAIDPASRTDGGRTRHGSMINPDPRMPQQGYDSAMFGPDSFGRFDQTLNRGLAISAERPLRLLPGSSMVSTVSHPQPGQLPQLETCAILTCLPVAPPVDAFRPPYCGKDKQCRWLASQLDLLRLARLEAPPGAPTPSELLGRIERPWLDHITGWTGRFAHPRQNMPDYGREIADLMGIAGLVLQLDHADTAKRPLAIAMVQIGIDIFGIVHNGGSFPAEGGSGSGRKFPLLLASALLQDQLLSRCLAEQKMSFAEDGQTFYVEQTSPGVWNRGYGDYGPDDTGLPEWGNQHFVDPSFDRKSWTSDPYRRCCTANVWHGFVLATRIMGLREAWNHPALFDYVDRYMQIESAGTWTRSWDPFAERMWDRYRAAY